MPRWHLFPPEHFSNLELTNAFFYEMFFLSCVNELCICLEICLSSRFMSIVLWPGWLTLCQCYLKMHVVGEGPGATLSVLRHFLSLISSLLIAGSRKKQESSRKTSISALLTMPKPLTVWITINCGKFWERWEYQTPWPASWETYMQVRKQQLELDMEQQTASK